MNRRQLPGKMACRSAFIFLAGLLVAATGTAQDNLPCDALASSIPPKAAAGKPPPQPSKGLVSSSANQLFFQDVNHAIVEMTYAQGALAERNSDNSAAPLTAALAELKAAKASLQSIPGAHATQSNSDPLPRDLKSSLSDARRVLACATNTTGLEPNSTNTNVLQKTSLSVLAVQTAVAEEEKKRELILQAGKSSPGFVGILTKNSLEIASCVFSLGTLLLLGYVFQSRHAPKESPALKAASTQMAKDLAALNATVSSAAKDYEELLAEYKSLQGAYTGLQQNNDWRQRKDEPAIAGPRYASELTQTYEEPLPNRIASEQRQPELPSVVPAPAAVVEREAAIAEDTAPENPPAGPLEDYNQARLAGGSEAEAEFKKKYSPCISVACTNLSQRSLPGVQFLFKPAARASFLAAAASDGKTYLLPQFSTEYPYARPLMEGPFIYPSGEVQELRLLKAGELKSVGEEWELAERGVFGA